MLSKSTKAKRRKNAAYYRMVSAITTTVIDRRDGICFYLISSPRTESASIHLEAKGEAERKKQYHAMLSMCRELTQPPVAR